MQMTKDFDWDTVAYWEHYKGGRYVLCEIGFVNFEEDFGNADVPEDMQTLVVYQSLEDGRKWARRRGYFFGQVEHEGKMVSRFRSITWREAAEDERRRTK